MNQKHREYLVSHVSKIHRAKVSEIEKDMPKEPSMNNHLIAAFLDNTVVMKDLEGLKSKIKDRVIKLGSDEALISEDTRWNSDRKKRWVKLNAVDLFEMPQSYLDAVKEYECKRDEIHKQVNDLNAVMNTIEMKINIGSDKHLQVLIEDVDNIADLNLVNSQLLLKEK